MTTGQQPEPWLRGTHQDLEPIARQVVHALELTREDIDRWCSGLTDAEWHARPSGLEPLAFHIRHIARSLDRLLTYAEGRQLTDTQLAALRTELVAPATADEILSEFHQAIESSLARIRAFAPAHYADPRKVGRAGLPATVGGLLVHCADHTQRHTGQAVTTAKLLRALKKHSAP